MQKYIIKRVKRNTCNNFWDLKEQSTIASSIVIPSFAKDITNFKNVLKRFPVNIHNFACRCLTFNGILMKI